MGTAKMNNKYYKHWFYPMGSISGLEELEDIEEWQERYGVEERGFFFNKVTLPVCTITPKYNGMACELQYKNGTLINILSRGDGKAGLSQMDKIDSIVGVPPTIADRKQVSIRGELIMNHEEYKQNYKQKKAKSIAYATCGFMRKKAKGNKPIIEFYGYTAIVNGEMADHDQQLKYMEENDINPVQLLDNKPTEDAAFIARLAVKQLPNDFCDGVVIRLNDAKLFEEVGSLKYYIPLGVTAYKQMWAVKKATVEQIDKDAWVFYVKPVTIEGVHVTKVLCYNKEIPKIGDNVRVTLHKGATPCLAL